jgi:hypothetical protein
VYRIAGAPPTWHQRLHAAQLAVAGAGGVASYVSAAALHGLLRPSLLPHVTVPPGSSARCPIAKVHRSLVPGIDRATVDGIATTSVSRTVVDLAAVLDRPSLDELVDGALCGSLASPEAVLAALDRAGDHRRGRVTLTSALDVWTAGIEPGSPGEARLLRRLGDWGLPEPVTQYVVEDRNGVFVARVDVAWPSALVGLEYEGVRYHGPRRFDADERRYETLRELGWWVAAADKRDLLPGAVELRDRLRSWLLVRQATPHVVSRSLDTA